MANMWQRYKCIVSVQYSAVGKTGTGYLVDVTRGEHLVTTMGRDVCPRWDSLLGSTWDQGVASKDELCQTTKHTGAVKSCHLYQGTSLDLAVHVWECQRHWATSELRL